MGNTFDINIQTVPASLYTGTALFSFGQTRSLGVRGINKLVNVFFKCLLTPIGTDPVDITYGTCLANLIGSNVSVNDVQEILQISVSDAVSQIQAIQAGSNGVAADERLASAIITGFIEIPDAPGFAAQVYLTNVANEGLTVILPALQVGVS